MSLKDIADLPDVDAPYFTLHWNNKRISDRYLEYEFSAGDTVVWSEEANFEHTAAAFRTLKLIVQKYQDKLREIRMTPSAHTYVGGDDSSSWENFVKNVEVLGYLRVWEPDTKKEENGRTVITPSDVVFLQTKHLDAQQLKDASQLPDLKWAHLEFNFSIAQHEDGLAYLSVKRRNEELWRERSWWGCWPRVVEAVEILEEKYGLNCRRFHLTRDDFSYMIGLRRHDAKKFEEELAKKGFSVYDDRREREHLDTNTVFARDEFSDRWNATARHLHVIFTLSPPEAWYAKSSAHPFRVDWCDDHLFHSMHG